MKNCSRLCKETGTRGWISRLQATRMIHTCQACQKLKSCASCCTIGQKSRLTRPFARDLTQSRGQVAKTPCLGKTDFSHSFSPYYIYTFIPTIQRELLERILREKPQKKTRLTYPQSLPKRLFKFLYYFPFHCQILERLITKTFSHHIHFCKRVVWCFGKQLGMNQFHID